MPNPILVDGPAPAGVSIQQPTLVDGPAPSGVTPSSNSTSGQNNAWMSTVKPFSLSNGVSTVVRPQDNAVWLDQSKGDTSKAPGWYNWNSGYSDWTKAPDSPQASVLSKVGSTVGSAVSRFGQGAWIGLKNTGSAIGQSLLTMEDPDLPPIPGDDAIRDEINQSFAKTYQDRDAQLQKLGTAGKVGNFTSQAVAQGALAATLTPEVGAAGFWTRAGANALGASVSADLTTPGSQDQKAMSALVAAPMTVAGQAVMEKVIPFIGGKAADALAGTKFGDMLGLTQKLNPDYAGAPELAQHVNDAGIRISQGDATGDLAVRAREDAIARNNPDMMKWRQGQNQEASNYADQVLTNLKQTVKDTGWTNLSDVQAASMAGGPRSEAATTLLTAIQNSGDDWKEIAQQSGNLQLFLNKLKSDSLFDNASAIAGPMGKVPPTNLTSSLTTNIAAIKANSAADQSVVPYLENIAEQLKNGTQKTDFASLRDMRTALNDKLEGLMDPNSVVQNSSTSRNAIINVTKNLEGDLDAFANNSGNPALKQAYSDASNFYKTNVVPYKEAAFGKALADEDPLKAANLFQGQNTAQQQRFYDLLDPKGQASIRLGLVQDAVQDGGKAQKGVLGLDFSPAAVATKLEGLQAKGTMGVAFQNGSQDSEAALGLAKILRTVDRSGNAGFIPQNGMTAESLGANVEGNTTVLGAAAKTATWLNRNSLMKLYTDPNLKGMLIRANDLTPNSPALMDIINNKIPQMMGIRTGSNIQGNQPQAQSPVNTGTGYSSYMN